MRVASLALFGLVALTSVATADVELKNDGFASGDQAIAELGFNPGEAGAVRYVAPDAGRQLLKVQLLFGNTAATKTITFKVWDDTAGALTPGTELYSNDFQLTGSDSALSEISIASDNVIVPQQFRVGILFQSGPNQPGVPSIMKDNDGNIMQDKNYILTDSVGWQMSKTLGVTGDWVIRAFVNGTGGGGGPDAGTGAACSGNTECPIGQFCDLSAHACTFECRTSADCGDGSCNSLGMCVAANNGGGGGCCQTNEGGTGASLLGLGVLLAVRRRRR